MELRHLRYFVAVATELNFTRAAETLLVAQPALSTQIASLEREIGTQLLFRNRRTVRLTAAGASFLQDARAILAAAETARENALRTARGEAGRLSLGFFSAPAMHFLPDLIRRYRNRYPDVTIQMRELNPDRQLVALAAGEIDFGFTRPLPPGHTELSAETLFSERWLAVVAETHPLAARKRIRLADLSQDSFVLLDRPVAAGMYDQVIAACQAAGFSPNVHQTPDLMQTVLTLVAAEQGVSIVPEGVQNLRRRQVVFLPVTPMLEPLPLIMCWRTHVDSPATDRFRELVREQKAAIRQHGEISSRKGGA
ncbi:MAG: LysR family transcriptional regulator [Planctomycetaceae bacterium]|nr:LysR family transcriptional regulator [Planctomycetaceae bacterium]